MGCSEVVIHDPLLHKLCLSVCIYTICVCEVVDALRWSSFTFSLACACMCVNACTVCVSDGCSKVVTEVFPVKPGLCHQLLNRTKCHVVRKKEAKKNGVQQLSERAVYSAQRVAHKWKYKQCWRCKWKVTLWGIAPLSILIAGRNICQTHKEPYKKETVF